MKIFSLTFLLFAFTASILSAQTIIDDFSDGVPLIQLGMGTNLQTTLGGGILGGERDESLTVGIGGTIGTLAANNGNLIVQQGAADQISGSIVYDNFSGVDLTSSGFSSLFALDFVSSDASTPLTDVLSISVTSGGTTANNFVTVPDSSSLGVATVDFASFTGIDFTSVDAISLNFDFATAPGRDFFINSFSTTAVPEPSSAVLCGLAVGGFLTRRRRNR